MAWRKFENHKEETKAVKKFLVKEGYAGVKVGHGSGTAWAWLEVHINIHRPADCYCNDPAYSEVRKNELTISCLNCGNEWQRVRLTVLKKLMEFTGRHGDYNGDISLNMDWLENKKEATEVAPQPPQVQEAPKFDMGWFYGD